MVREIRECFSGRISKRADGVGGRKEGKSVAERVLGVEVPERESVVGD